LAIKGRLEIGLKCAKTDVSRPGFFKIGFTMACLQKEGTIPDRMLLFIIAKIQSPTLSTISLKNLVGTISQAEVVGFSLATESISPGNVSGSNELQKLIGIKRPAGSSEPGVMDCLISSILTLKKDRKFSHRVEDSGKQSLLFGLKTEFKILNKTLGFFELWQIFSEK